jgi:hypothetical protein
MSTNRTITPSPGLDWDAGSVLAGLLRHATYLPGDGAEAQIPPMHREVAEVSIRMLVKEGMIDRTDVDFIAGAAAALAKAAEAAGRWLDEDSLPDY